MDQEDVSYIEQALRAVSRQFMDVANERRVDAGRRAADGWLEVAGLRISAVPARHRTLQAANEDAPKGLTQSNCVQGQINPTHMGANSSANPAHFCATPRNSHNEPQTPPESPKPALALVRVANGGWVKVFTPHCQFEHHPTGGGHGADLGRKNASVACRATAW